MILGETISVLAVVKLSTHHTALSGLNDFTVGILLIPPNEGCLVIILRPFEQTRFNLACRVPARVFQGHRDPWQLLRGRIVGAQFMPGINPVNSQEQIRGDG